MAQDFYAAFGQDVVGTIGTPTTINSGDMAGILMIATQQLEKRTATLKEENVALKEELDQRTATQQVEIQLLKGENAVLKAEISKLTAENSARNARLDALEGAIFIREAQAAQR